MIRPFNLRDLALVHRLSEQGVALHTELALIKSLQPVRTALFSLVGGEFPTFVWKADDRQLAGFIQLYLEEESHHGHILYLSSTDTPDSNSKNGHDSNGRHPERPSLRESAWLPLLDQAVVVAGRRGLHSLVAEVSETGDELPILRHAGFAVYTRQDIWKIDSVAAETPRQLLVERQSSDDWEIQLLYANIVPRLVQLVEPVPPLYDGQGWVLREGNDLAAFVHVHVGAVATWMRLYIHPNAESHIDDIVQAALQIKPATPEQPVYCCVRRYQSWIQNSLVKLGFSLWGSQAVMVKHTVQHIPKPTSDLSAMLDAQGVTPTTPFVQRYQKKAAKPKRQEGRQQKARHKQAQVQS